MNKIYLILFLLVSAFLLPECSQKGCPGGMCPPDHYYATRRVSRRMMTRNYNRAPLFHFGNGTGWSRKNRQLTNRGRHRSIERKGATLTNNNRTRMSNPDGLVYDVPRIRNKQSRYLNKNKINSRKTGHQEGLWSPRMQNWKAKLHPKHKKARNQKVKTKKLK